MDSTQARASLILFGGKGGVGKTTCASAAAIALAERGVDTLLLSTDPAHSLSDCLDQPASPEIIPVTGVPHLDLLEVDAEAMLRRFKEENAASLREILASSTYLDDDDVSQFLTLTIPGLDEVMGMKTLMDLMAEDRYGVYVLDTAPTGHALRLLSMPSVVDGWIKVLARMRYKYRSMVSRLVKRSARGAPADDFLFDMKRTIKWLGAMLRDGARCQFVVVTIPEAMVRKETLRLMEALAEFGISVRSAVINGLLPDTSTPCELCRVRQSEQAIHLKKLKKQLRRQHLVPILRQPHEVRGLDSLREIATALYPALTSALSLARH